MKDRDEIIESCLSKLQCETNTMSSFYSDHPHRKHYNRKTFVAGHRMKWTKYDFNQSISRTEYGFPSWYYREEYLEAIRIWGSPNEYVETYRKWTGEPPRFNLKYLLRKRYESFLDQGIKLKFRMLRFKDGFV